MPDTYDEQTTLERHAETMRRIHAAPAAHGLVECVLCHRPGTIIGFFFPYVRTERRLRIPKGGMIAYCLCGRCERLPNRNGRVEARLFADLTLQ